MVREVLQAETMTLGLAILRRISLVVLCGRLIACLDRPIVISSPLLLSA